MWALFTAEVMLSGVVFIRFDHDLFLVVNWKPGKNFLLARLSSDQQALSQPTAWGGCRGREDHWEEEEEEE